MGKLAVLLELLEHPPAQGRGGTALLCCRQGTALRFQAPETRGRGGLFSRGLEEKTKGLGTFCHDVSSDIHLIPLFMLDLYPLLAFRSDRTNVVSFGERGEGVPLRLGQPKL